MQGQLRANLRLALRTVRQAKWRSLLTLTGIVIGIAAFIVVVAIGQGIKAQVSGQISQLGKNLIMVRAGQDTNSGALSFGSGLVATGNLTSSDIKTVAETKGVELAAPLSLVADKPEFGKHRYSGPVIATDENFAALVSQPVDYGNFFDGGDSVSSAVVGAGAAQDFFGQAVPVGESFHLLGQRFVTTGVFQKFDTAPLSLNTNFNNAIFVQYKTVNQLTRGHAPIYEILVKPEKGVDMNQLVAKLKRRLAKAHGQHDFTVLTQEQSLKTTNKILSSITKLIMGVAAIALLVGGVGIMDVMLVSVSERVSEIGLRKAVGASSRQILDQFVVEAGVLSAIGAVIGTLLALLASYIIYLFSDLVPIVSWEVVVVADIVAIIVGIFFGTIPALKAARKNPIEALRHE